MDAYRKEPERNPLAVVEGNELRIPREGTLPRVCVGCGTTKALRRRKYIDLVKRAGGVYTGYRGDHLFNFYRCDPCERAALNIVAFKRFGWLGAGVLLLGAATTGFGDYPAIGAAIAVAAVALAGAIWFYFVRAALRVAWNYSDGRLALRGVHTACARAAVEGLRSDAKEDDDEEDGDEADDDESDDDEGEVKAAV